MDEGLKVKLQSRTIYATGDLPGKALSRKARLNFQWPIALFRCHQKTIDCLLYYKSSIYYYTNILLEQQSAKAVTLAVRTGVNGHCAQSTLCIENCMLSTLSIC